MRAQLNSKRSFEFYFADLDNLLLVENQAEGVVIRATRNNFPESRKTSFIRELAAEGFISETYQWFCGFDERSSLPVRWLVDYSWLKLDQDACARTNRFMIRLISGAIILFLVMMSAVLISAT